MHRGWPVVLVCLACSLVLLQPILTLPSWYAASQSHRYPYLLILFKQQFLAGHWYPRWLPGLMGGYGYPTFVYYPPGFWFLALPISLLIAKPLLTIKIVLVLVFTLGGIGAYRLARCFCNANTAFIAMLAYYLTPELSYQLYETGDFAELTAMLLIPWVFYHVLMMSDAIKHRRPPLTHAVWLALTLACVAYTHAIVTVWLSLALILCVLGRAVDCRHYARVILIAALAAVLAAALSSPYWFSSLQLSREIGYGGSLYVFSIQSVPLRVIFDFYSERTGLLLPLFACAGFVCGRHSRFMNAAAFCAAFCVYYMSPYSLPLREHFSVLRYLQDPQRVLPVLAALQLMGMAFFLGYAELRWPWDTIRKAGIAALALLLLAVNGHHNVRGLMNYRSYFQSRPWQFEDMTNTHEFRPNAARIAKLEPRALRGIPIAVAANPMTRVKEVSHRTDTDVTLKITSFSHARILFNQFWFPGWQVEVNGVRAQACPRVSNALAVYCVNENGLIDINIRDAGEHTLHVWYGGVPNARIRNGLALLIALASLLGLRSMCALSARPRLAGPSESAHSPAG